jgi:hypothetical protein
VGKERKSVFATPLALLWAFPSAYADDANLKTLHDNVLLQYTALASSLLGFQNLSCLTSDSKNHLGSLQNNATILYTGFDQQYKNYMTYVQSPMPGNGKCDGGFEAVARESENRRVRSVNFKTQVQKIQNQLGSAVDADFTSPEIDMPDNSPGQPCANKGSDAYDQVGMSSALMGTALTQFQTGVQVTAQKFKAFSAQNATLGTNCGAMSSGLQTIVVGTAGPSALFPTGNSADPESTITGKTKDSFLTSGQPSALNGAMPGELQGESALNGSAISGSSGDNGSAANVTLGTDTSRTSPERNIASNGPSEIDERQGNLSGSGQNGTTFGAHSEEMAVQAIGKGTGAEAGQSASAISLAIQAANRPAPSSETLAGMNSPNGAAGGENAIAATSLSNGGSPDQSSPSSQDINTSLFERIHRVLRSKSP